MQERLNIKTLEPKAYDAMLALENYISKTGFETQIKELIKIRASQINGCAYCVAMHTESALKNEETTERLFAISVWEESPLFSAKERAALQMTEEITLIADRGLKDDTYSLVKSFFTDAEIAQMIMIINTINVWNRIAVSTHMIYKEQDN